MKKKKTTPWQRWKKKAPKVPDITCPDIDSIITKLEKLRRANESLRDSGEYWYSIAKDNLSETKK